MTLLGDRDARAAFAGLRPVPGGVTGLYDTTLAAYEEARSTYRKGKFNALVILTDGSNQDERSISRSGLVAELKALRDPERPVPVIAIAVGPDADRDEVAEIARVTGGDGYEVSDPAEIQAVPPGHHGGGAERGRRAGVTGPGAGAGPVADARLHACLRAPGSPPARCGPAPPRASARRSGAWWPRAPRPAPVRRPGPGGTWPPARTPR